MYPEAPHSSPPEEEPGESELHPYVNRLTAERMATANALP